MYIAKQKAPTLQVARSDRCQSAAFSAVHNWNGFCDISTIAALGVIQFSLVDYAKDEL
jgi:hypothetical protein